MRQTSSFSKGTILSFRRAAATISRAARECKGEVGPALRQFAEEILTDVKDARPGHGVPVKDGHLRGSGQATGPEGKVNPKVSIAFGGPAAPYALVQHEVLTFHHNVGESRYLVRGLERWKPAASNAYAAFKGKISKALKKE